MTRPFHRRLIALGAALAASLGFLAPLSLSSPAWAASDVSLVGSFESEATGCVDWAPQCPALTMTPVTGAADVYAVSVDVPAGAWEFQVSVDATAYGADGGDERSPLWLAGPARLEFRVELSTHVTTITPQGAQAPGASPGVALPTQRASAPGERFYFLLADRFANGDPSNDDAVVADNRRPDVVTHPTDPAASGYDPTKMGFYQGGDLQGVIDRLDYIKGLGATAIWISPPFVNMPVSQGSAGYHGYWITDFTHIDPHLGGDAAMERLIQQAHGKGLKVFFDIVLNDTADTISYQGVGDEPPYVSLATRPYTDASGTPFDPADYATGAKGAFPPMDPATSFPYVPYRPDPTMWLVPEQLNDLTWYHNRGSANTSGNDESTLYGDFSGLDDLMTERPELATLMVDEVAAPWLARGVDGFRIDTVKYVGLDFWALFDAGVHQASDQAFVFGEAYDQNVPQIVSPPMRVGGMDGMLDFPYALALPAYLRGGDAGSFARVFDTDAYYATGKTSASDMVTFVDNHDMGRLGSLLGPGTTDLQRRVELAYELTYLVRGQPVVYYGDEQGFLGTGGDVAARQPMFGPVDGSYTGSPYASSPLAGGGTLGSDYASHPYDTSAPIYRLLAELAALRNAHPALSRGDQVTLGTQGSVFVFDRLLPAADGQPPVENVVAVNSSDQAASVEVTTLTPGATYQSYYPADANVTVTADASGAVTLNVPALGVIVLEADQPVAAAGLASDGYSVAAQTVGASDQVVLRVEVPDGRWTQTSFFAREVGADPADPASWMPLGVVAGPSAKVFVDASWFPPGALLEYRAVTTDSSGVTVAASVGGGPAWLMSAGEDVAHTGWAVGLGAGVIVVLVAAVAGDVVVRKRRR